MSFSLLLSGGVEYNSSISLWANPIYEWACFNTFFNTQKQ